MRSASIASGATSVTTRTPLLTARDFALIRISQYRRPAADWHDGQFSHNTHGLWLKLGAFEQHTPANFNQRVSQAFACHSFMAEIARAFDHARDWKCGVLR
jgi:hypothetical protein